MALATAGAVASASSTYGPGYSGRGRDQRRSGGRQLGEWRRLEGCRRWDSFPEWVEVDFATSYSISQVNVFSGSRTPIGHRSDPTSTQTFTAYGLRSFDVQYWTGRRGRWYRAEA